MRKDRLPLEHIANTVVHCWYSSKLAVAHRLECVPIKHVRYVVRVPRSPTEYGELSTSFSLTYQCVDEQGIK